MIIMRVCPGGVMVIVIIANMLSYLWDGIKHDTS